MILAQFLLFPALAICARLITPGPDAVDLNVAATAATNPSETTSNYDGVQDNPRCLADNCARAVTGTCPCLIPYETRRKDCSSYMTTTVTSAAATQTVTSVIRVTRTQTQSTQVTQTTTVATVTTTQTAQIGQAPALRRGLENRDNSKDKSSVPQHPEVKRQAPSSAIPYYASNTCAPTKYSSACSCWGIFPGSTTVAAQISTTTTTVTSYVDLSTTVSGTTTARVTATATTRVCGPKISGTADSRVFTLGVPNSSSKVVAGPGDQVGDPILYYFVALNTTGTAHQFTLGANGALMSTTVGRPVMYPAGESDAPYLFLPATDAQANLKSDFTKLQCVIGAGRTGTLVCGQGDGYCALGIVPYEDQRNRMVIERPDSAQAKLWPQVTLSYQVI